MATIFNYDWFTGGAFEAQKQEARKRCAVKKFDDLMPNKATEHADYQKFLSQLEIRTLIYLRDGFSYEMKEMVDIGLRNNLLTFECEPVDEQYKVGAFTVSLPFDEIIRVEVFAVHPSEKPEDVPLITGFRSGPSDSNPSREDQREPRDELKPLANADN